MANCLDYAKIAYAAYFTGPNQYYEDPSGHMVDDWTVQHWKTGTFSDAFQGGIWTKGNDIVVGICGTNPKQKGKLVADLLDDARIGLRLLPNQASAARKLVRMAKALATGTQRVSVCGHSLGGGLSQVCGVWEEVPFVTFNAPAMKHVVKAARINIFKPQMMIRTIRAKSADDTVGVNFRIRGMGPDGRARNDPVSIHGAAGGHIGMAVNLPAMSITGAHGKNTCWQAVLATDWAFIDPFGG